VVSYLRHNVDLRPESVRRQDGTLAAMVTTALSAIDAQATWEVLHRLGRLAVAQDVRDTDFGTVFDLPSA
jgi:hypothetical protein